MPSYLIYSWLEHSVWPPMTRLSGDRDCSLVRETYSYRFSRATGLFVGLVKLWRRFAAGLSR